MIEMSHSKLVKKLCLGTAQFGLNYGIANRFGQVSFEEVKTIIETASANGINTIDTANAYGDSEAYLGNVGVKSMRVVTKLLEAPSSENVTSWVKDQVFRSLSRLGLNSIYGLLLHCPSQLDESIGNDLFRAIMKLKENGTVKKIGISIYSPDELAKFVDRFEFDLVQAPFNLVDRRIQTSGWLSRLKDRGIEIHTRSTFLQGLLLMPLARIPAKFSPWSDLFESWHQWMDNGKKSAIGTCLAYPLHFPEIDRVIVGVDSLKQFTEIISLANQDFEPLTFMQCNDEKLINLINWKLL
jgi:aryl-alcohol dehydrogenase-like predicted oxidoreductase